MLQRKIMQGRKDEEGGNSVVILCWVVREVIYEISLSRDLKWGNKACGHLEEECSLWYKPLVVPQYPLFPSSFTNRTPYFYQATWPLKIKVRFCSFPCSWVCMCDWCVHCQIVPLRVRVSLPLFPPLAGMGPSRHGGELFLGEGRTTKRLPY